VSAENQRFIQHLLALGAVKVSQDHHIVRLRLPVMAKPDQLTIDTPTAERFRQLLRVVLSAVTAEQSFA